MGFPGGPVVKNLPANSGDTGLIPGLGQFHVSGQLSLFVNTELMHPRACAPQQEKPPWEARTLQQRAATTCCKQRKTE